MARKAKGLDGLKRKYQFPFNCSTPLPSAYHPCYATRSHHQVMPMYNPTNVSSGFDNTYQITRALNGLFVKINVFYAQARAKSS